MSPGSRLTIHTQKKCKGTLDWMPQCKVKLQTTHTHWPGRARCRTRRCRHEPVQQTLHKKHSGGCKGGRCKYNFTRQRRVPSNLFSATLPWSTCLCVQHEAPLLQTGLFNKQPYIQLHSVIRPTHFSVYRPCGVAGQTMS